MGMNLSLIKVGDDKDIHNAEIFENFDSSRYAEDIKFMEFEFKDGVDIIRCDIKFCCGLSAFRPKNIDKARCEILRSFAGYDRYLNILKEMELDSHIYAICSY